MVKWWEISFPVVTDGEGPRVRILPAPTTSPTPFFFLSSQTGHYESGLFFAFVKSRNRVSIKTYAYRKYSFTR